MKFNCPHCDQSIEAPDELAGTSASCPTCNGTIAVPSEVLLSMAPTVNPPQTESIPEESEVRERVTAIVQSFAARIEDAKIFFQPNIPPKKLRNAISGYAPNLIEEDVLALVDNTTFGNAKDGALLTSKSIYVHNIGETPKQILFEQIGSLIFVDGMIAAALHINDTKFLDSNFPKKDAMRLFTEMLREITKVFHPIEAGESSDTALQEGRSSSQTSPDQDGIATRQATTVQSCEKCHAGTVVTDVQKPPKIISAIIGLIIYATVAFNHGIAGVVTATIVWIVINIGLDVVFTQTKLSCTSCGHKWDKPV